MKTVIAEKKLATGEQARVVLIVPPEEDGLRGMYAVGTEWKHYYNRAMIVGHDQFIEDRVFIAEVDGVPAARLWYGWSSEHSVEISATFSRTTRIVGAVC